MNNLRKVKLTVTSRLQLRIANIKHCNLQVSIKIHQYEVHDQAVLRPKQEWIKDTISQKILSDSTKIFFFNYALELEQCC